MELIRNYPVSYIKRVEVELEKLLNLSTTDETVYVTQFEHFDGEGFRFKDENYPPKYIYILNLKNSPGLIYVDTPEEDYKEIFENSERSEHYIKKPEPKKIAIKILDAFGLNEWGFKVD